MKKSAGFIMTVIGTVLAAAALFLYLNANNTNQTTMILTIIGLVCGALYVVAYAKLGSNPFVSLLVSAAAIFMAAALAYSFVTEAEILGYLISGLRTWADVQTWAYFAVAAALSWLVLLIASCTRLGERQDTVQTESR